jgi:signal transduction histidine kinase
VLIEEFTFASFKGLILAWREKDEFTVLDGNLTKLLCTQLSFSLPITRYVTDLRLERDRSQTLRRIAFRTAEATSVGSAVRIVAEELAGVLHADRFFWMVSGNQSDMWLSEVYRGSGLPVRQTRHLKAEESECLEPLVEACNESHNLFCERFPRLGGDEITGHRAMGAEIPCPFLRRGEGAELARCLRSLIRQAGMLGRESGALAVAPVTVSSSSWGILCAYSDVGGAFTPDDMCFMCLAASTVRHMWQAVDAAGSVRRLQAEGETVSELAHDLKYPLMRMSDSLGNLASGKRESHDGEPALEILKAEVERLELLARELIDTSNRKKKTPEIIDSTDVLEYCLELIADDASGRSIEVRKHVEVTPPPIFANPQDVKSILINILANSIDAAGEGGWIDITVEVNADRGGAEALVLTVQNSGPGVPRTELDQVFDPFYSTKETGSGMGLFSSKKRARANGGDLVCEIGPDGQSRFVIWFPVASG